LDSTAADAVRISVIMPVYNGLDFIERSLPPLLAMRERGEVLEVIVVDDGSDDGSDRRAAEMGARVMPSGGRLGPGGARNRAAELALGDLLWFVDADVVAHDDAALQLRAGFSGERVVAVFGSYDDRPAAQNFFSQYKNLVHHYYHQRAGTEAYTFWSGCGAVRRDAFLAAGGFDVERFKYPSIEDIDLGHRLLQAGGRVVLRHDFQCTHLKEWRFLNLLHTEVFRRAIPWSRLIVAEGGRAHDLNVSVEERLRAAIALLAAVCLAAVLAGLAGPALLLPVLLLVIGGNLDIGSFFLRCRGAWFACRALLFHQVYYLYSGGAFAWVVGEHLLQRWRSPGRTGGGR